MAAIGFIGVGNMGGPMVRNLIGAGHSVTAFDLAPEALERAVEAGAREAASAAEAARAGEVVITMLPAGRHARVVYLGDDGVIAHARQGALLIDCSTIDVETARMINAAAAEAGFDMLDAPVSAGSPGPRRRRSPSWSAAARPVSPAPSRSSPSWAGRSSTPGRPATVRRPRSATT